MDKEQMAFDDLQRALELKRTNEMVKAVGSTAVVYENREFTEVQLSTPVGKICLEGIKGEL